MGSEVRLPLTSLIIYKWVLLLLLRISFNLTLFIAGVFGIAAGGAPNFITLTALTAVFSVGVGGNLPVDSAVFLGVYSLSEIILPRLSLNLERFQSSYQYHTSIS